MIVDTEANQREAAAKKITGVAFSKRGSTRIEYDDGSWSEMNPGTAIEELFAALQRERALPPEPLPLCPFCDSELIAQRTQPEAEPVAHNVKEIVAKLRYMGRQYSAGQVARGGTPSKHYLEEAADLLEARYASPPPQDAVLVPRKHAEIALTCMESAGYGGSGSTIKAFRAILAKRDKQ